jgi:hypothetical protein
MAIDKDLNTPGLLKHPFTIENTFINSEGESKTGDFSTQAFHCVYDPSAANYNFTIKDAESRTTRITNGFRQAVLIASALNENYELDNGITEYDILSRLDRRELYTLEREVAPHLIADLKNGTKINVPVFNVKNITNVTDAKLRRSGTRLVQLKAGGTEIQSKYTDYTLPDIALPIDNLTNTGTVNAPNSSNTGVSTGGGLTGVGISI